MIRIVEVVKTSFLPTPQPEQVSRELLTKSLNPMKISNFFSFYVTYLQSLHWPGNKASNQIKHAKVMWFVPKLRCESPLPFQAVAR